MRLPGKRPPRTLKLFIQEVEYRIILEPRDRGRIYGCISYPYSDPERDDIVLKDLQEFEAWLVGLRLLRRVRIPCPSDYINSHSATPHVTVWPVLGRR